CDSTKPVGTLHRINVTYFNARSVKNKLPSLYSILYSNLYHIVCVSESWLNVEISDDLLDPKGRFNIFRDERARNQRSGGVCVFVNKSLNVLSVESKFDGTYCNVVQTHIHLTKDCVLTILCCYIPPNILNNIFIDFIQYLSSLYLSFASFILI